MEIIINDFDRFITIFANGDSCSVTYEEIEELRDRLNNLLLVTKKPL